MAPRSPAPNRSATRSAPLGICDGSGWILGPEDVARPCDCRAQRLNRGHNRGISSVIPARYRGVSFDRPPVSDMARDLQTKAAVERGARLRRRPRPPARRGARAVDLRRHRHRQDDAGDADLEGGAGGRQERRDLLAAETPGADPPHLRLRTGRRQLPLLLRQAHLGRPPPHRRPRRRETLRLGAGAALRAGQRALRDRALGGDHHQPRPRGAGGADRLPNRLPADPDLRRSAAVRHRSPLRATRAPRSA